MAFLALIGRLIPAEIRAQLEGEPPLVIIRDYTGIEHETVRSSDAIPDRLPVPARSGLDCDAEFESEDDVPLPAAANLKASTRNPSVAPVETNHEGSESDPSEDDPAEGEEVTALRVTPLVPPPPKPVTWEIRRPWENERPETAETDG